MADQKPKQDDVLTTVARTVGTALAKVASAASNVTRGKSQASKGAPRKAATTRSAAPKATRASRPAIGSKSTGAKKKTASAPQRAQQKKKIKRAKHKHAIRRKTAG